MQTRASLLIFAVVCHLLSADPVFQSKSIPLFRPMPGCPPPLPSSVAAATASSSSQLPSPSSSSVSSAAASSALFLLHSMCSSPDYRCLVLTSRGEGREVLAVSLDDVEVQDVSSSSGSSEADEPLAVDMPGLQLVQANIHAAPVNDLALAQELPLIVSCSSATRTVRVHNYLDRQCELVKTFEFAPLWSVFDLHNCRSAAEDTLLVVACSLAHMLRFSFFVCANVLCCSVSFHPLGHEIAVGFHLNLLTFRVHASELLVRGEFGLGSVSHCRYSHGGQYLAAVSNKTLWIYAPTTTKTVAKFQGHGDAIMAIYWNCKRGGGDAHERACNATT